MDVWSLLCLGFNEATNGAGQQGGADWRMNLHPDTHGFFHVSVEKSGRVLTIDVLPPAHRWKGQAVLEGHAPDARMWLVYTQGELIGRVDSAADVGAVALLELDYRKG